MSKDKQTTDYYGKHCEEEEHLKVIRQLMKSNSELDAEVEKLAWNLGGCSTFALGYDLDKEYSKELARPALIDVRKAMIEKRELQAKLDKANKDVNDFILSVQEAQSSEIRLAVKLEKAREWLKSIRDMADYDQDNEHRLRHLAKQALKEIGDK